MEDQQNSSPFHRTVEIESMYSRETGDSTRGSSRPRDYVSYSDGKGETWDDVLIYLALLGSHSQELTRPSTTSQFWKYFLGISFVVFTGTLLASGLDHLIRNFHTLWWIIFFSFSVKCVLLGFSVLKIRQRVTVEMEQMVLGHLRETIPTSLRFVQLSLSLCMSTNICYSFYTFISAKSASMLRLRIIYFIVFTCGIISYNSYIATVLLFSYTDAKVAQTKLKEMKLSAAKGTLEPSHYRSVHQAIQKSVAESERAESRLIISMFVSFCAGVLLVFMFSRGSANAKMGQQYNIALVVYMLTLLLCSDILFFVFLFPQCAEANALMEDLHGTLAEVKWHTAAEEQFRYDTLHLVIAKPVRYTMAGIHMTRETIRRQMFAAFSALLVTALRFILTVSR